MWCLPLSSLCVLTLALSAASAPVAVNLPPEPTPTTVPEAVSPEPEVPLEAAAILPPLAPGRTFKVAHLRGSDEVPLGASGFEALRRHLELDAALRAALRAVGREEIEVISTDSHLDLIRRMDTTEFDVVFAPSLVYVLSSGEYEVLAQISDPSLLGSGEPLGLFQTSVIFVNSASPLYRPPSAAAASPEDLRALGATIAAQPMALVSASSAVGYVYPLLTLRRDFGVVNGPPIHFRDTAEEVVLGVLNNLYPMGACDEATLDRVLAEWAPGIPPEELVFRLRSEGTVPAAPVVMRRDLVGPVGQAFQAAMRAFLATRTDPPLSWSPASDRMYGPLRRSVAEFYAQRGRR